MFIGIKEQFDKSTHPHGRDDVDLAWRIENDTQKILDAVDPIFLDADTLQGAQAELMDILSAQYDFDVPSGFSRIVLMSGNMVYVRSTAKSRTLDSAIAAATPNGVRTDGSLQIPKEYHAIIDGVDVTAIARMHYYSSWPLIGNIIIKRELNYSSDLIVMTCSKAKWNNLCKRILASNSRLALKVTLHKAEELVYHMARAIHHRFGSFYIELSSRKLTNMVEACLQMNEMAGKAIDWADKECESERQHKHWPDVVKAINVLSGVKSGNDKFDKFTRSLKRRLRK